MASQVHASKTTRISLIEEYGVECDVRRMRYDDTGDLAWVEVDVYAPDLDEESDTYDEIMCVESMSMSPVMGWPDHAYAELACVGETHMGSGIEEFDKKYPIGSAAQ